MIYTGNKLKEISFPLGGIGTGCIGLAGNGALIDWEILNRPNKNSINGFSHFAISAKLPSGERITKIVNGDHIKNLSGIGTSYEYGFGWGPVTATMSGFPHFENCVFDAQFPIAKITFTDKAFPGKVTLTAFNPMIPLKTLDSSLPVAFFDIAVENLSDEDIEYTFYSVVENPSATSKNIITVKDGVYSVKLFNGILDKTDKDYYDITVATDSPDAKLQEYWYRGAWRDGVTTYWREITSGGLTDRHYDTEGDHDKAAISVKRTVNGGNTGDVRFVISWNAPNNYNYWTPLEDDNGNNVTWKNYYATVFESSTESAAYALGQYDRLYSESLDFATALATSTLDDVVIDAASANLSVLKSPTVTRLENGELYGWEGVSTLAGSCEGSCQHVWNYAYALCYLFPDLERSMRELQFKYNLNNKGEMQFRLRLPLGREDYGNFRACVDGQMGEVIKVYREWKISGDNEWLKKMWPSVKQAVEYAWSKDNADKWDLDFDGVLEGRQHHTLDMELFGPSSWLQGFYVLELRAAAQMAKAMGDGELYEKYSSLSEAGRTWIKENLFNGEYFVQKIDLSDKSIIDKYDLSDTIVSGDNPYWNEEAKEIKYQIADGCEIDQMLAEWHASLIGLGEIYDKEQRSVALKSLYKYNYRPSMRNIANAWRVFALGDEGGTVMCNYPEHVHLPAIPISYCDEVMTGFEYSAAGLMISEGMIDEGLRMVTAVRDRYDGEKRNPWNEIECGSNYARSMASFALLPIFSGFEFDMTEGFIGFDPKVNKDSYKCLFSLGTGWGCLISGKDYATVELHGGSLELKKIHLPFVIKPKSVTADGEDIDFTAEHGYIRFNTRKVSEQITVNF